MNQHVNHKSAIQPVILCGGSGTRLWPLSRTGFPKQFLCLTGEESLFQQAARRLSSIEGAGQRVGEPMIVAGEDHRFLATEQLREVGLSGQMVLEPVARNTAPALTLAALASMQSGDDPVLVVTPADQTVQDPKKFASAIHQAITAAQSGSIVILGVSPTSAETGYGYIQTAPGGGAEIQSVARFVEKPDQETAQRYLSEGDYLWNAGMFVLKASVWLSAIEVFRPDVLAATRAAWEKRSVDGSFIRPGKSEFAAVPAESVDYAVMEHCPGSQFPIHVVALDAGWSDLGSWDA
ncbi:MAG: mannose-1-phosphate guanylyltransferase, partial [Betaproteobacteria bacterium]|nr:mannose-1-phosphate guanylyltransferase [Betaproteobacteria bacterium]